MIIYKTTNLLNNKVYIGKDTINNPTYYGSGLLIRAAIKKYGKENFKKEIIETCPATDILNEREKYWIDFFKSTDRIIGYNLTDGGTGGQTWNENNREKNLNKLRDGCKKWWQVEENRKLHSFKLKERWKTKEFSEYMKDMLGGREIAWKDKISKSVKNWYDNHPHPQDEKTRKRIADENRIRFTGKEFKSVSKETELTVIKLYQTIGPRLIAKETGLSQYIVIRVLKKAGVYQKWQKGIGDTKSKQCSISRCGDGNPMFKSKC